MITYICTMKSGTLGSHWGVTRVSISVRLHVRFTVTHQVSHIYIMNWFALYQGMMFLLMD